MTNEERNLIQDARYAIEWLSSPSSQQARMKLPRTDIIEQLDLLIKSGHKKLPIMGKTPINGIVISG